MRKKFLATLLVGAIAVTGVIGFTACNNDGEGSGEHGSGELQKGEQVNAAQWQEAFFATAVADNYTLTVNYENKTVGTKKKDATVKYTYTDTQSTKLYFDLNGKKILDESVSTAKSEGGEAIGEEDVNDTVTNKLYYSAEGSVMWRCDFNATENKWTVNSDDYGTETAATEFLSAYGISGLLSSKFSATSDGKEYDLSSLYDAFTYSDGFYTATLYSVGFGSDETPFNFTVSLKDGYFAGVQLVIKSEAEDDGFDLVHTMTASYVLSDIGTTTVTTPSGAAEAIEAAKTPADDGSVAGKTFGFGSLEFEFDASVSAEIKAMYENIKPQMEAEYAGSEIIFGNNGEFTMPMNVSGQDMTAVGTYTESNNTVVLTPVTLGGEPAENAVPQTFTYTDNTLSARMEEQGITIIINYVLQA
ncbi:MAG: hypothetical protein K2O89_07010 [Clostridia bacterium]|nr:hypothetical protein [Clostridia bacterium]